MTYTIQLCQGPYCRNNFSDDVNKEILTVLTNNESDRIKYSTVNCMQNCQHGPSFKLNNHLLSQVTPKEAKQILKAIKQKNLEFINNILAD